MFFVTKTYFRSSKRSDMSVFCIVMVICLCYQWNIFGVVHNLSKQVNNYDFFVRVLVLIFLSLSRIVQKSHIFISSLLYYILYIRIDLTLKPV